MVKFLIRRILFMILTMFIVSIVVFALTEIAPGNIARNTLGNLITPEQEASFNAQNGLNTPAPLRYVRWIFGSDWQGSRLIGRPVRRIYDPGNERYSWWAVDENGALFQAYTTDSETMIKVVRQPDGSLSESPLGPEVCKPQADGSQVFWGVDREEHAAMWVRGKNLEEWTLRAASGNWSN
ncbi:MAG: hypothetical protein ACRDH2_18575, partial [Anaerolineales bacterium]